jgi:RNA polymerase-associated protein
MHISGHRKSMLVLYSGTTCPFSHRCRLVLHEKGMDFQIIDVDLLDKPEDLAILNPYNQVPVLVERDLILYESNIINEYLDERFPYPQLMPVEPAMKARVRLLLHRFEAEIFSHVHILEKKLGEVQEEEARTAIREALIQLAPFFEKKQFLIGDEMTIVDIALAPLLWRLSTYAIKLPNHAQAIYRYADRLFARPAFQESLTPSEKAMRRY